MLRSQRIGVLFIALLAGQEAARVGDIARETRDHKILSAKSFSQADSDRPEDLDSSGCNSLGCRKEGCKREYIWLDTPSQSCRYTEEYKLTHNQEQFLKVELTRLEYKSRKFKKTGCIITGFSYDTYMFKCVRRMKQMVRLLHFVDKVKQAASSNSAHPAHAYATSDEAASLLANVGENLAAGFDKFEKSSSGSGLKFGAAFKELLKMPQTSAGAALSMESVANERAMRCGCESFGAFQPGWEATAAEICVKSSTDTDGTMCAPPLQGGQCPDGFDVCEDGEELSEVELQTQHSALVTAAMLKTLDVELTEEQKTELLAQASDAESDNTLSADEMVDALERDIDRGMFDGAIAEDEKVRGELSNEQRGLLDEKLEEEGALNWVAHWSPPTSSEDDKSSQEQQEEQSSESSPFGSSGPPPMAGTILQQGQNGTVVTRGTGPLKWIFKHGLGWVVTRIMWVVLFLLGTALGVIRAGVIFPLLLFGCMSLKFIKWLFADLLYAGLWDGDAKQVTKGLSDIITCGPEMWEFVGFDASQPGKDLPGQVIMQPARFASEVTGVVHPVHSQSKACEDVRCGANAKCYGGNCQCLDGFFPAENGNCGLLQSEHGCACMARWTKSSALPFVQTYNGCNFNKCKVDTFHASYSTCKANIPTKQSFGALFRRWLLGEVPKDSCRPQQRRAIVPKLVN